MLLLKETKVHEIGNSIRWIIGFSEKASITRADLVYLMKIR